MCVCVCVCACVCVRAFFFLRMQAWFECVAAGEGWLFFFSVLSHQLFLNPYVPAPWVRLSAFVRDAGLYVILDLHGAPGSQNGLDNSGLTSPDPNELVRKPAKKKR